MHCDVTSRSNPPSKSNQVYLFSRYVEFFGPRVTATTLCSLPFFFLFSFFLCTAALGTLGLLRLIARCHICLCRFILTWHVSLRDLSHVRNKWRWHSLRILS